MEINGLRLALLLVGIVVVLIVAVVSYDRRRIKTILGRRTRPRAGQPAPRWSEPALASQSELDLRYKPKAPPDDDMPVLVVEPVDDELPAPELEEYERAASMPLDLDSGLPGGVREQRPDPMIDFVARLPGDTVVLRDDILGEYKQHEYLLDKPHRIFGRDAESGGWRDLEKLAPDTRVSEVELSLQLIDGAGRVTESDLNKLAQLGLRLADRMSRPLKFSMTFEEAQEKAVEMQKFCEEYDVLVIVNMEPTHGGVFRGRLIEVAARKNGLVFGEMNIFHRGNRRTRGARQLFSMASLFKPGEFDPSRFDEFTTGGLTFFMTIPVTYDPPGAFDEMLECVHGMCESLDGRLIDRDREPLTDDALARIRVQLQRITADMENRGVPPGGETAMRLF